MTKQDITKIKHYDLIQQMCIMDDELMEVFFAGHNECVELLVRVILGRDDLTIISSEVQKTLKGLGRSVRLDVYAVDREGRRYNIEFQREDSGAVPERARFNASMIDVASLEQGKDFTALPEVYVIFITEHDVLGGGLPLYTIEQVISQTGKLFGSGTHIVYVNGEHRDASTALGRLVQDLFRRSADETYNYDVISGRMRYIKCETKEERHVSRLVEEYAEARAAKEAKKQQKSIAQRMIEGGELALTKIAEYTGLSISTVRRMAKKLETAQQA